MPQAPARRRAAIPATPLPHPRRPAGRAGRRSRAAAELAPGAELFAGFEALSQLTLSALNSDVYVRMRDGPAAQRWRGVQQILADALPGLPEDERLPAAPVGRARRAPGVAPARRTGARSG